MILWRDTTQNQVIGLETHSLLCKCLQLTSFATMLDCRNMVCAIAQCEPSGVFGELLVMEFQTKSPDGAPSRYFSWISAANGFGTYKRRSSPGNDVIRPERETDQCCYFSLKWESFHEGDPRNTLGLDGL